MKIKVKLMMMLILLLIPINFVKADIKTYLDVPTTMDEFGDSLYVGGWIMSDSDITVQIKIDNDDFDFSISRLKREDVLKAIVGYGGREKNPTPGFEGTVNISNLKNGVHLLEVFYYKDGILLSQNSVKFNKINNRAKLYLDYPSNNDIFANEIILNGWLMTNTTYGSINVLIDNIKSDFSLQKSVRKDVIKKITGYGNSELNKEPGFNISINSENLSDGIHSLVIQYCDQNGNVLNHITKQINIKNNHVKYYLDSPVDVVNGLDLNVSGWILSQNTNLSLKLYIDDKSITDDFDRVIREDVLKSVTGYGDKILNPTPGFVKKIDLENYTDGKHNLKIYIMNKDKVIDTISKTFMLKKYNQDAYLDSPVVNQKIIGTNLKINGWYLNDHVKVDVQYYIDDKKIDVATKWMEREDVIKTFKGQYQASKNSTPGFEGNFDLSSYKNGIHNLKVVFVDKKNQNSLYTINSSFNLTKYKSDFWMDSLDSNNNGGFLNFTGWILSDSPSYELKFLVDGIELDADVVNQVREDVVKAYRTKYNIDGQNRLPGFTGKIDLSKFKDGTHQFEILIYDKLMGEEISQYNFSFNLKKYSSKFDIDSPKTSVSGENLTFSGWVLSDSPQVKVNIYFDDKMVIDGAQRVVRDDVLKVYGNLYGMDNQNSLPGFYENFNLTRYNDGVHKITYEFLNPQLDEVISRKEQSIVLKKYDGKIELDYPNKANYSNSSNLKIEGWELSDCKDSIVKIFFDQDEISVSRTEREDVLLVYGNSYHGRENNLLPGFSANVDLSKYVPGDHVITIKLYNPLNEEIASKNYTIFVHDKVYFGIDVSAHQGKINWGSVSNYGVDFSILRLGYGDNFSYQDDNQFVNNVNGVTQYNIPYGVYLYSYALRLSGSTGLNVSSESIDSEVEHVFRLLNSLNANQKKNLKLPIYIDMEDSSTLFLGRNVLTQYADRFCSKIVQAGYQCGIYANKNWFNHYLDSIYLEKKYHIWLAHYTDNYNERSDYARMYQIWQYSSSGSVSGIKGNVDMNVSYKKYW